MQSGKAEGLPYSLSRWTDIPASKWSWFKERLEQGVMNGFDPRALVPSAWSLRPEDVQGLIFWTKDPRNLIKDAALLKDFPLVIHLTLTGWTEVEKNAPDLALGIKLLQETIATFGADRVVWRFSPIPQLMTHDVLQRFTAISVAASHFGLRRVYAAFLQENDRMPESRSKAERGALLWRMAERVQDLGIDLLLCQDDRVTLETALVDQPKNLKLGVCEDGKIFGGTPPVMDCGCALSVDPFTINEACSVGCKYCYAADKSLSPKRRNTTLKVLR